MDPLGWGIIQMLHRGSLTPIGQEGGEKVKTSYEQSVPLARPCAVEDVAEAVVWLVDGARTVTGELLLLDSGMHLGGKVSVPGTA